MSTYNFENIEKLLQKTYKQAIKDIFNSKEGEMNGIMIKNLEYFENKLSKISQKSNIQNSLILISKQNEDLNSPMIREREKLYNINRKELFF